MWSRFFDVYVRTGVGPDGPTPVLSNKMVLTDHLGMAVYTGPDGPVYTSPLFWSVHVLGPDGPRTCV